MKKEISNDVGIGTWLGLAIFGLLISFTAFNTHALEIKHVSHNKNALHFKSNDENSNPEGSRLSVNFEISAQAKVELNIYDIHNVLVKTINNPKALEKGEHQITWSGKDQNGKPVQGGGYHYTLSAQPVSDPAAPPVVYDLTDLTGAQRLQVSKIKFDEKKQTLSFAVPKTSLVSIRIGIDGGGPLLRTLLDWQPRIAGYHSVSWDGFDESGFIRLDKHEKHKILVSAFSLSDNTFIVEGDTAKDTKTVDYSGLVKGAVKQREKSLVKRKRLQPMNPLAQKPQQRGDFDISLGVALPEDKYNESNGVYTIDKEVSKIPFRLRVSDEDSARALNQRFEVVFFVDGVKVFENEIGYFPMTWYWDTSNINSGSHYITANLLAYTGNVGVATLKVEVQK